MGIAELFFVLIFVFIVVINIIFSILRSREKGKSGSLPGDTSQVSERVTSEKVISTEFQFDTGSAGKDRLFRDVQRLQVQKLKRIRKEQRAGKSVLSEKNAGRIVSTEAVELQRDDKNLKTHVKPVKKEHLKIKDTVQSPLAIETPTRKLLEKIDELPVLKKAVVFSEIISVPKALRD